MRKIVFGFAVVAAVASALAQAVAPAIENEEQSYGASWTGSRASASDRYALVFVAGVGGGRAILRAEEEGNG